MKKELLFAILAGGILGLIIAFGIWRVNLSVKTTSKDQKISEAQQDQISGTSSITLANWENNAVSLESTIEFTGLVEPNSIVIVSSEDDDFISLADEKGNFTQEVDLIGGINQFFITSFDLQENRAEALINIVYSSEFTKAIATPEPTTESSATEAAKKMAEAAAKKPLAYLGVVTDLTDTSLQLKGENDEIFLVNTSDETSYVKVGTKTTVVKSTDVAIGDYLIAMGFKNEKGVLDTQRIILTSTPEALMLKAFWGNVEDITTTQLKLNLAGQTETSTFSLKSSPDIYSFILEKTSKIKISAISEGDKIIVVADKINDQYSPRSLFLVE